MPSVHEGLDMQCGGYHKVCNLYRLGSCVSISSHAMHNRRLTAVVMARDARQAFEGMLGGATTHLVPTPASAGYMLLLALLVLCSHSRPLQPQLPLSMAFWPHCSSLEQIAGAPHAGRATMHSLPGLAAGRQQHLASHGLPVMRERSCIVTSCLTRVRAISTYWHWSR